VEKKFNSLLKKESSHNFEKSSSHRNLHSPILKAEVEVFLSLLSISLQLTGAGVQRLGLDKATFKVDP
jgi:hypothetical protein